MTRSSFLPATPCGSASGISEPMHRPQPSRRILGAWISACLAAAAATLTLIGVCGAPTAAAAQSASYFDRNNNISVMERPRPDYQAPGIDLGAFQLFPSVTGAEAYDDNIFATDTNRVPDWISSIGPSLDLKSNWSRNSLELTASDVSSFYASHTSEDTNDYKFNAFGRFDTTYDSNFSADIAYEHAAIPRTSELTLENTLDPIEYGNLTANVSGVQTLNRLQFSETIFFDRFTYADATATGGGILALSQLNSDQTVATVTASWALGPDIALSATGQYNVRQYDDLPPATPLDRNSMGYEALFGADFDITRLVRGQIKLGYLSQDYQSPLFHRVEGPVVHAKVEYFLSGLTTITLHADRNVVDDVDPVAVSFLQTEGGVQVDHELLRNVILSGRASYETDDYTGVQRDDHRTSVSARATYLMNRHLGLTAAYSFIDRQSTGLARIGSYDANVVSLSLVFQL
jgi:hypothetical protein